VVGGRYFRVAQESWHILYALQVHQELASFHTFFQRQNQKKICDNTVAKDPTTPQMCRKILANFRCL